MVNKIKGGLKDEEIREEKKEFLMRLFVNDFLLWFLAVDVRFAWGGAEGEFIVFLLLSPLITNYFSHYPSFTRLFFSLGDCFLL